MSTGLYRMPTRPQIEDEDGTTHEATDSELLNRDIKPVGTESGDEIVHVAKRGPDHLPDDATKLYGTDEAWDWPDVRSEHATVADAVLESVHEADVDDGDGNTTTVRIRDKVGNGKPANSEFRGRAGDPEPNSGPPFDVSTKNEVESDLPPHAWGA